jgi:hypothetical protein
MSPVGVWMRLLTNEAILWFKRPLPSSCSFIVTDDAGAAALGTAQNYCAGSANSGNWLTDCRIGADEGHLMFWGKRLDIW